MTRRSEWPEYTAHDGVPAPAPGPGAAQATPRDRNGRGRGGRRRGGADTGAGDASAGHDPAPRDPVERARAICLRLLTGTPRTRRQLADALRAKDVPEDAVAAVLDRFEEVGLIDDAAFADAWVESRHHGRGLARRALAQELRGKGVAPAVIEEAVGRLDGEREEATARELVDRKLRTTRGLDRDRRVRRLVGMLARKGYPQGLALRVVRQALEEESEDAMDAGDIGDVGDVGDADEFDWYVPDGA